MVIDYRELNKVTVRKFFLIPNSDYIKSTVAGNEYVSVGDLKEGFNQVDNEPETRKKMAVLSAGGCWLPRGLTFGPTNGPEDFQELVFTVFQRRLYKDWFLFVDDLSVATGRKKCHGDGPSGAHDVSCALRPPTPGEKATQGSSRAGAAFRSPHAHGTTEPERNRAAVMRYCARIVVRDFAMPLRKVRNPMVGGAGRRARPLTFRSPDFGLDCIEQSEEVSQFLSAQTLQRAITTELGLNLVAAPTFHFKDRLYFPSRK